jgi:hypothetical protein
VSQGGRIASGAEAGPLTSFSIRDGSRDGQRSRRLAISERTGVAIGFTALLILAATEVVTLALIFVNNK